MKFTFYFFLLLLVIGCEENITEPKVLNCNVITNALLNFDNELTKEELNKILSDLKPNKTSNNPLGHENNLNIFMNRLETQCSNIEAELLCYACIETLPPQSEIKITIDSSGTLVNRVLDILTPEGDELSFRAIHGF